MQHAAGSVVLRVGPNGLQLLVIHRPRYDDWSLPKGKLRPDETGPVAAVRETLEETGYTVRLGAPAGSVSYDVDGRAKNVDYWRATATGEPGRRTGSEVDETRWLDFDDAVAVLAHDNERTVAFAAASLPATSPLIIARHAKAQPRKDWPAADPDRPLAKRGNDQAVRLAGLLAAWAPARVVSSPSLRCVLSIQPYAALTSISVELETRLSEEGYEESPETLVQLLELVRADVSSSVGDDAIDGVVLCTHRPVLPAIADTLGVPLDPGDRDEALPTAGCWVLHLSRDGTVAVERHAV